MISWFTSFPLPRKRKKIENNNYKNYIILLVILEIQCTTCKFEINYYTLSKYITVFKLKILLHFKISEDDIAEGFIMRTMLMKSGQVLKIFSFTNL